MTTAWDEEDMPRLPCCSLLTKPIIGVILLDILARYLFFNYLKPGSDGIPPWAGRHKLFKLNSSLVCGYSSVTKIRAPPMFPQHKVENHELKDSQLWATSSLLLLYVLLHWCLGVFGSLRCACLKNYSWKMARIIWSNPQL